MDIVEVLTRHFGNQVLPRGFVRLIHSDTPYPVYEVSMDRGVRIAEPVSTSANHGWLSYREQFMVQKVVLQRRVTGTRLSLNIEG